MTIQINRSWWCGRCKSNTVLCHQPTGTAGSNPVCWYVHWKNRPARGHNKDVHLVRIWAKHIQKTAGRYTPEGHCVHACAEKKLIRILTFWRRNYFFLILAQPVYKMWIIQEPNTLELWNKLHFEEGKKRRVYTMLKIFGIYISWINI